MMLLDKTGGNAAMAQLAATQPKLPLSRPRALFALEKQMSQMHTAP